MNNYAPSSNIENNCNYFELDASDHEILLKANNIGPESIEIKKSSDLLVFSSPNERFIIKCNVKISENDSVPSFVTGNISHMLYNYAVKYLDDGSLKEKIDFDGFFYIGAQRNVSNISVPFRNTHKLNIGKDCLSVICLNNNLNSVIFSLSSEFVPEYTVIKKHLSSMKMSKTTFINIVNTVIRQFGAIISKNINI